MRKRAGARYQLMDYFNLLLLPLLVLVVVFILIWGGMCVLWSMIMSNQSLIRIKPRSFSPHVYQDLDNGK